MVIITTTACSKERHQLGLVSPLMTRC